MVHRPLRRATALAIAALMATAGAVAADGVRAVGDSVVSGQDQMHIGEVAPSAVVDVSVPFRLSCTNGDHVDTGQTVTLTRYGVGAPGGGAVVAVTDGTIGPVPLGWTADGATCPIPRPTLDSTTSSVVTLRAPATPNVNYTYTIAYSRILSPAGGTDGSALSGTLTTIVIRLDVVANTPPTLTVPDDMTVEADTAGGWTGAYDVSATDLEDDPDPVPTCDPAVGHVLPLGTTTVSCSVTDGGGRMASDSFDVTVVDTTAPTLGTAPDVAVTTDDPAGTTFTYAIPSASDVADTAPVVACTPISGSAFPIGSTVVGCTATDASGNASSGSFLVDVAFVPSRVATVGWGEPVGAGSDTFVANHGRTIPVKATLSVDGQVVATGAAFLHVTPCAGGAAVDVAMAYSGGRWIAALDTAGLSGWCHTVSASIDGLDAGSFTLDLRGGELAKAKARAKAR